MKKIAIFASGNGSNFQALVEGIQQQKLAVQVVLLVCDQPQAHVLQRAQQLNIPTWTASIKQFTDKTAFETAILTELQQLDVGLVLLAGYMRIIGPTLLQAYPQRIINIHPALLPQFPGRHGIEDAFAAGVEQTGVTVHYVDAGIDSGPIIQQAVVPVQPQDTVASLSARIHQTEHWLYLAGLEKVLATRSLK
ncbi:phosphoribosylglycinamide formyltransferase [Loigolactobacillus zhaoyuanensis]|uniref:phosphoribosylglycinamide formyltransferase n=1 Tax=Loigolactobacillus zhaoyuanensis TaxID=2486017 RepID=UPI000F73527D|nr:phosphoribosylglycinamide formyltransferase [Loigolactobacillus zhaoyuanensis]